MIAPEPMPILICRWDGKPMVEAVTPDPKDTAMVTTLDAAAATWASDLFASGQAPPSASYWIEEDIAGMEAIEEAIGRQMTGDDRANADAAIRRALAVLENESV